MNKPLWMQIFITGWIVFPAILDTYQGTAPWWLPITLLVLLCGPFYLGWQAANEERKTK